MVACQPRDPNDRLVAACGTEAGTRLTCSLVPAVMLEMVQQASFLMLFLWLVVSRFSRHGKAPQLMMTCVWRSSPVTMLPTVRNAGTSTDAD